MTFCCLREAGIHPAVEVLSMAGSGGWVAQYYDMLREEIGCELIITHDFVRRNSRSVLDAFALSVLPGADLTFNLPGFGLPVQSLASDKLTFPRMKSILGMLERLDSFLDPVDDPENDDIVRFADLLGSASQLDFLILGGRWEDSEAYLERVVLHHIFPEMRSLILVNWIVTYGDLEKFLRPQPKLEYFELDSCTLRPDERSVHLGSLPHGKLEEDLERQG